MAKPKLLVLKGLPASGKSTYAKRLVAEQGYARTNKDTIRKEMFGEDYKRKDEKKVVKERDRQIREYLTQGRNVVVDDTNLNPVHIKELALIAREFSTIFEVDDSFLDVSLTECIERDSKRGEDMVGEQVIRRMYHEFVAQKFDGKTEVDLSLPYCIISDIDGTLAHMNGKRKPYDWHKVGLDDIDLGVAYVLDGAASLNNDSPEFYRKTVFLFSGRDEVCRPETEEWLERHGIEYDHLYMRRSDHLDEHGGQVKDTLVKEEMYEKYIKGKYNVLFIMDDRPQVCRMWRDKYGLRVMNLGDPYYEF